MQVPIDSAATVSGSRYPSPYDAPCLARVRKRLGDAAGLSQFGVNLLRLTPGTWSSQRHWHTVEDEFVFILAGDALVLEVGSRRDDDEAHYPDIDLHALQGRGGYAHKDGRPYPGAKPLDPATGK